MAAVDNEMNDAIGIPRTDIKLCTIYYYGREHFTTVRATGKQTTLDSLREKFPNEQYEVCPEDDVGYYETLPGPGPECFAYRYDGSNHRAFYWENARWSGYKTLYKVEFSTVNSLQDFSGPFPTAEEAADQN